MTVKLGPRFFHLCHYVSPFHYFFPITTQTEENLDLLIFAIQSLCHYPSKLKYFYLKNEDCLIGFDAFNSVSELNLHEDQLM